jgi:serine/threonine protein kinase
MAVIDVDEVTRFGPYLVLRRIGTGGSGSIFEAEDSGLGHRVALKLLHPHVARRPGATARFLREGRAAARIRHPHVVQVFALGTEGTTPYLAMELLDGGDLAGVIARQGPMPMSGALDLVLPVVAALAAAHDAGVIHRDLKPSNIGMALGPDERPWPKVLDFGVSKVIAGTGVNELTVTGAVIGTAAYMAPEQVRAACNASFRSDQYSLAVLLYQCLTGKLPFAGRGMYEILESVMSAPLAPPSTRATGIPRALDEAVLRAMSRDPADRFASVRAFGAALLPLASERTHHALGAELYDRCPREPERAAARDVDAIGPGPDSLPSQGETVLPPAESRSIRMSRRRFEHATGIGIAALVGLLLLVTNLALHARMGVRPAAVIARAEDTTTTARAPQQEVHVGASEQDGAQGVKPAALSSSPVATPVPASVTPPVRKTPRRHSAPWTSASASPLSIGDNGAPILP